MSEFNVKQLRGMANSLQGVAMDVDDPEDAATCTISVDWMHGAGNEIERLRERIAALESAAEALRDNWRADDAEHC